MLCEIILSRKTSKGFWQRRIIMKGYTTGEGYMGLVEGAYMLFASEEEYREYVLG